jgi:hypothetical protein
LKIPSWHGSAVFRLKQPLRFNEGFGAGCVLWFRWPKRPTLPFLPLERMPCGVLFARSCSARGPAFLLVKLTDAIKARRISRPFADFAGETIQLCPIDCV